MNLIISTNSKLTRILKDELKIGTVYLMSDPDRPSEPLELVEYLGGIERNRLFSTLELYGPGGELESVSTWKEMGGHNFYTF